MTLCGYENMENYNRALNLVFLQISGSFQALRGQIRPQEVGIYKFYITEKHSNNIYFETNRIDFKIGYCDAPILCLCYISNYNILCPHNILTVFLLILSNIENK